MTGERERERERLRDFYLRNRERVLRERRENYWANAVVSRKLARDASRKRRRERLFYSEQWKSQAGLCFYCGKDCGSNPTFDHVVPLSGGGSDVDENKVVACLVCNGAKRDLLAVAFVVLLAPALVQADAG